MALTGCDVVLAMEYSTYMVISPEACSSILFRTREKANFAAQISQITAQEALKNGIIDDIIVEHDGPAHHFPASALQSFKSSMVKWIDQLNRIPAEELFSRRMARWEKIGQWDTITEEEIVIFEKPVTYFIPKPKKILFVARHKNCIDNAGKKVLDPVLYTKLFADNFTCEICGHRYVRLTAHDYIALVLDQGSFIEHRNTKSV